MRDLNARLLLLQRRSTLSLVGARQTSRKKRAAFDPKESRCFLLRTITATATAIVDYDDDDDDSDDAYEKDEWDIYIYICMHIIMPVC